MGAKDDPGKADSELLGNGSKQDCDELEVADSTMEEMIDPVFTPPQGERAA